MRQLYMLFMYMVRSALRIVTSTPMFSFSMAMMASLIRLMVGLGARSHISWRGNPRPRG